MKEIEKQAIDIITDLNTDFRAICINIAKNHPSVLVKSLPINNTEIQVRKVLESKGKVPAIKLYRELTRCSLFDAKNYVESL